MRVMEFFVLKQTQYRSTKKQKRDDLRSIKTELELTPKRNRLNSVSLLIVQFSCQV